MNIEEETKGSPGLEKFTFVWVD